MIPSAIVRNVIIAVVWNLPLTAGVGMNIVTA